MESEATIQIQNLKASFSGKKVLVTGDTGFKGSWLCQWLVALGADVVGIGLPPSGERSLFDALGLSQKIDHRELDVREAELIRQEIRSIAPDFVFHLAAQAIVRESYVDPIATYSTNILGTAHVLDALRALDKACAVVVVTTDKSYENFERVKPYTEEDILGGHDPYSSSKAAAELIVSSFRRSFFNPDNPNTKIAIASARAGNALGGGDYGKNRLIPDSLRAIREKRPISIRNIEATRPWMHVLDSLNGYLQLGASLHNALSSKKPEHLVQLSSAFNFGPDNEKGSTVVQVVEELLRYFPGSWEQATEENNPHEACLLQLSSKKAKRLLGWTHLWDFEQAVQETANWYIEVSEGLKSADQKTLEQIEAFTHAASISSNK